MSNIIRQNFKILTNRGKSNGEKRDYKNTL
jgi:hypothetical protein